jgi:hypothetical protein
MPEITPAFWSAVAATASAAAALFVMRIQYRNYLDAGRAELILSGWGRARGNTGNDFITFASIKNAGKGSALHPYLIGGAENVDDRPTAFLPTIRLGIIEPGGTAPVDGAVEVIWRNVPPRDGSKYLAIELSILFGDARNRLHETRYDLFVVEDPNALPGSQIAPGVSLSQWSTASQSIWSRKLRARLAKIPGLRRLHADWRIVKKL